MNKMKKLANFNDQKWSYDDLKRYARKYREKLKNIESTPERICYALNMYQCLPREILIERLKRVQEFLYK